MKLNNGIHLTWLGHSTFKIEADGQTLLIDPWVTNNPVCPDTLKTFDALDVILITHGHARPHQRCRTTREKTYPHGYIYR